MFVNSGCDIELSPLTCTGNTSGLTEGTVGVWWRFLHGNFGMMELGAQYAYIRRNIFPGVGGEPAADENIVMASFAITRSSSRRDQRSAAMRHRAGVAETGFMSQKRA